MPGESKKISELESASSLNNGDLLELASVNALSETGYSSKKTTIEDVADKIATLNPQAQADWTEADNTDPSYIQNKPTLATVATSGSYNDLQDQPQIPDAQVNSDWNSVSGVSEILNKPTLGTAASKNTGVANGVAELDANGLVPTSQLPAYVDDVLEYASQSAFPATGETGKIYVALDTNLTYRWGGSAYVEISPSLALGETSSTAYAGNKGKANADAISAIQTTLSGLATVATTGDYDDLIDKPTINDATITFTQGGTTKGTITLNQSADATIALDAGGGGGASALADLTDVTITNPTAGQVLKYDDINDEWVNGTGGGGSNSVELTYAEYQALTPEQQLDGTEYFITDINGDGQDFQPIIYSEDEREIGVWTDGKPLYEKTITFPNPRDRQDFVAHNIADVDRIFVSDWHARREAYLESVQGFEGTGTGYWATVFDVNPTGVSWRIGSSWGCDSVIITFRYTKTTDQAGSGTWTPQGVPAHHYSNNEQVVGTWIDGSTLYEQTLYFNNKKATQSNSTSELVHGITDIGTVKFVESAYIDFDGGTNWATAMNTISVNSNNYNFAWVVGSDAIYLKSGTNGLEFSANADRSYLFTIQYTKSST